LEVTVMLYLHSHPRVAVWAGLLVVLAVAASTSLGATLPQYEDFSAGTAGGYDLSLASVVDSGGVGGMSDTKALSIAENGGATLDVTGTASNVICHLYIKPDPWEAAPDAPTSDATAMYVSSAGELTVYTGTAWTAVATVPTDGWIAVAVHMDFGSGTFDVFLNTNGTFETTMERATGGPFDFADGYSATDFTALTMTNSASSAGLVDMVAISPSHATPAPGSDNLRVFRRKAGRTSTTTIPPDIYAGANRIVAAGDVQTQLGADMALALADGSIVYVPTATGYEDYTLGGGMWGAGTLYPEIDAGQGILLSVALGSDSLAMYPYADAAVGGGATVALTMKASNDVNWQGYTGLALPASHPECVDLVNGSVFESADFSPAPNQGDIIYFYREDLSPPGRQFFWTGSAWSYDGDTTTAFTVCPGDEFIYYNTATATPTWTVAQ
jgi:hypothetical protein